MLILDSGALDFAVDLAKPMVAQTRAAPGQAVPIPPQLTAKLNAMLEDAMFEDVLALRERERMVPADDLRLRLR
ncbi:MAG: hypothetical protein R3F09_17160 [Burkholderiaceae bacterium]